jgi:hypothetical protein
MEEKMLFYMNSDTIQIENLKTFKMKFFKWLLSTKRLEEYNAKDWKYCAPWIGDDKTLIPINYDHNNMIYRKDFTKIKTTQDVITYGDFFNFIDYVVRKSRETKIEKLLN